MSSDGSAPVALVPAEPFTDGAQQAHAARLGMWVFLASELLLFAGLFTLFAAYRTEHPDGFRVGVEHATKVLGSINTAVLLVSSTLVALAVSALRRGRTRTSALLVLGTIALGGIFLAIKIAEYLQHFREGIHPGGHGAFFDAHPEPGLSLFWTLYFGMTGLHAVHVAVGASLLAIAAVGILSGRISQASVHRLEIFAIYWHLVDLIWIFLWPLFYLA